VHPVFGLRMPTACPGVDAAILNPRNVWRDGAAYDSSAERLRGMFRENFEKNRFEQFGIEAVM
jgi:phosphoenolpyruvate carboxykinase (ATP)